jgi:hypothetical protein
MLQQAIDDGFPHCCQSGPWGWKTRTNRTYHEIEKRGASKKWVSFFSAWLFQWSLFGQMWLTLDGFSFNRKIRRGCQCSACSTSSWHSPCLVRGMRIMFYFCFPFSNRYSNPFTGSSTTLRCNSLVSLYPRCHVPQWRILLRVSYWCWLWISYLCWWRDNYHETVRSVLCTFFLNNTNNSLHQRWMLHQGFGRKFDPRKKSRSG